MKSIIHQVSKEKRLQRARRTSSDMFYIVRGIAVARDKLLNAYASFECPVQDVHLRHVSVMTVKEGKLRTHLIQEQNQSRLCEKRTRADFLPQVNRVFQSVDMRVFLKNLIERERREKDDGLYC